MKIEPALKKQIAKSVHDAVIQYALDKLAGVSVPEEPQDYVWEAITSEDWCKNLEKSDAEDIDALREAAGEIINDTIYKQIDSISNLLKSLLLK
jgi:hypothetical protein